MTEIPFFWRWEIPYIWPTISAAASDGQRQPVSRYSTTFPVCQALIRLVGFPGMGESPCPNCGEWLSLSRQPIVASALVSAVLTTRIIWRLGPDAVPFIPFIALPLWFAGRLILSWLVPPKLVRRDKTIGDGVVVDLLDKRHSDKIERMASQV